MEVQSDCESTSTCTCTVLILPFFFFFCMHGFAEGRDGVKWRLLRNLCRERAARGAEVREGVAVPVQTPARTANLSGRGGGRGSEGQRETSLPQETKKKNATLHSRKFKKSKKTRVASAVVFFFWGKRR